MNGQLQHLTFYYDLFARIIFITPVHWSYLHSSFMTCIAQSSHSSLVLGGGEFIHPFLRIGEKWSSGKNTQGTRKWTCLMGDTFSNGPCSYYYCASLPECIPYHHMLLDESEHVSSGGSEGAMRRISGNHIFGTKQRSSVSKWAKEESTHSKHLSYNYHHCYTYLVHGLSFEGCCWLFKHKSLQVMSKVIKTFSHGDPPSLKGRSQERRT